MKWNFPFNPEIHTVEQLRQIKKVTEAACATQLVIAMLLSSISLKMFESWSYFLGATSLFGAYIFARAFIIANEKP